MLIVLLLLAALASPGETSSLPQVESAPGAWVEWSDIGVAAQPQKVWLHPTGGGPPRRAKLGFTEEGGLRLRVPRVEQGDYDLRLRSQKAPSADGDGWTTISEAVCVQAPQDLALSSAEALPGDVLEITGRHLGPRRGRVEIASRRARVVSWETDVVVDALGASWDRVRIRVPRRIGDGVHPLVVITAAGETCLADAVSITGSEHGVEPVMRGEAGELRLESKASTVQAEYDEENGVLLLRGFDGKGKHGHWLRLSMRYDPSAQGPAELRGNDVLVQLVRFMSQDSQAWSSAYGWGGFARVSILENDAGLLRGTVTGWLEPVYGQAAARPLTATFSVLLD
ncbi:MAG: hypothetical protein P8N09_01970 [Planctomycetota bacterium]|nr:hypothetical protein [Planctomycetota bacterium]